MAYKATPEKINFDHEKFDTIVADLANLNINYTINHDYVYDYIKSINPFLKVTFVFEIKEDMNLYKLTGSSYKYIDNKDFRIIATRPVRPEHRLPFQIEVEDRCDDLGIKVETIIETRDLDDAIYLIFLFDTREELNYYKLVTKYFIRSNTEFRIRGEKYD